MKDRCGALGSCIRALRRFTGEGYHALRARYAPFLDTTPATTPSEQQMLDALAAVERVRNPALERLRAFERQRIRAKLRGQRFPSKAERRLLEEKFLCRPRATSME